MITAITPGEPVEYVAISDRDETNKTTWLLRNLSIKEEDFLNDMALKVSRGAKNNEKRVLEAQNICINLALIGARNFKRKDGTDATWVRQEDAQPVHGEIKPWTDETLVQIPYEIRAELYGYIIGGYRELKETELKN